MATILVIDDDEMVRGLLRRVLEREGYEVIEAGDGDEGLTKYRNRPADLVVTDVIMPGKEGIETIRELLGEYPDAKIIAISGGGRSLPQKTFLGIAEHLGAIKTFSKPLNMASFIAAVKELIKDAA
jgi:DNA-binding response OmpR family regulator